MWQHFKRDVLMFVLGASGFLHEIWITQEPRPEIILGCFALMGLPLVLNGRNGNGGKH